MSDLPPELDALATPLAWLDGDGRVARCNLAFARWLGVSQRRLLGRPLTELDAEGDRLAGVLARLGADTEDDEPQRVHRARLAAADGGERFAELWLVREAGGGARIEAHPVDEFPGADPAMALPAAMSAAFKGLAHELRNPLAGMKGAAQLLGRRVESSDARGLVELIVSEVDRLASLVDRLIHPAPARAFAPVNIHAVLERVRQLADAEAGWAVKLVRDYDPSLPEVEGD